MTRNTKTLIRLRAIAKRRGDLVAVICLTQRIRAALEPFGPRAA
jgi:hypothetical protein